MAILRGRVGAVVVMVIVAPHGVAVVMLVRLLFVLFVVFVGAVLRAHGERNHGAPGDRAATARITGFQVCMGLVLFIAGVRPIMKDHKAGASSERGHCLSAGAYASPGAVVYSFGHTKGDAH